jgi:hypothetical protein
LNSDKRLSNSVESIGALLPVLVSEEPDHAEDRQHDMHELEEVEGYRAGHARLHYPEFLRHQLGLESVGAFQAIDLVGEGRHHRGLHTVELRPKHPHLCKHDELGKGHPDRQEGHGPNSNWRAAAHWYNDEGCCDE